MRILYKLDECLINIFFLYQQILYKCLSHLFWTNGQPKEREIFKTAFNDNGSRDDGKRSRSFYSIFLSF